MQGDRRGRQSRHDTAGRVEAAFKGVRLNTDAIDNSAGVNTSDVEVNIKIALSLPVRDGRLKPPERNALLAEMTEEVARARAAQQLSADARALARRAARPRGPRLPAAADADAGAARPARPRRRVPARRHGDRRAAAAREGAHAAGARRAARLCQAHAQQRAAGVERPRRSLPRPRDRPLLPEDAGRALSRCARAPSAAARDHRRRSSRIR